LIKGYQATTGTIIVTEEPPKEAHAVQRVAIYARGRRHEHRPNLERQMERLEDYCAARGYQIATAVKEIASGANDARPKFLALLSDPSITTIVVEQKDRATRFGFRYLETLLGLAGRRIEVVNLAENDREDLLADLVSIMYSLFGRSKNEQQIEQIEHCIERAIHTED
jgi:putative resolvase